MNNKQNIIDFVYAKYEIKAGGFPQGFCGQIAEEIKKELGGEIVAGFIDYRIGWREHWWVELHNEIIDPMLEALKQKYELLEFRHIEIHRDLSKKYW